MSEELTWAEQRRRNAQMQASRLAERKAQEHRAARALIQTFVGAAKSAQLPTTELFVTDPKGRRGKTGLEGWYLKADKSAAISPDGDFFLLEHEISFLDRFRVLTVEASEPPLILGAGGRDGESIDLSEALDKLLPGWRQTEAEL